MKIDMHVHSKYSTDGKEEIEDIIKQAKRVGLSGIAITDHNCVKGWGEAVEFGKKHEIIVIKGEEVSSSEGHILAYGIREKIEKGLSPEETVKKIREKGGIAVAAHPYRISNGVGESVVRRTDFDAIEGMNARSPSFINRKGIRLAQELRKPMTGGSDAHTLTEIGRAYTVFPPEISDVNGILKAIKTGKASVEGQSQSGKTLFKQGCRKIGRWVKRGFRRI